MWYVAYVFPPLPMYCVNSYSNLLYGLEQFSLSYHFKASRRHKSDTESLKWTRRRRTLAQFFVRFFRSLLRNEFGRVVAPSEWYCHNSFVVLGSTSKFRSHRSLYKLKLQCNAMGEREKKDGRSEWFACFFFFKNAHTWKKDPFTAPGTQNTNQTTNEWMIHWTVLCCKSMPMMIINSGAFRLIKQIININPNLWDFFITSHEKIEFVCKWRWNDRPGPNMGPAAAAADQANTHKYFFLLLSFDARSVKSDGVHPIRHETRRFRAHI